MNNENSKTNESNRFRYNFTNKLNLKNPSTDIALSNLSIYYISGLIKKIINLKYTHQLGMKHLIYLMVVI